MTIEIIRKDTDQAPAGWLQIQSEDNDNIGGWYNHQGPKGFPMFSSWKNNVLSW